MEKRDVKKELKHLYRPSAKTVVEVDVPAMNFLMIDGKGPPGTSTAYQDAVAALFAVSYHTKFAIKKSPVAVDYGVMPLEGLWWADNMDDFVDDKRDNWLWTMMMMQPDLVDAVLIDEAKAAVKKKKGLVAVDLLRFENWAEGLCAQTLHIGPFTEEGPTIERVHAFIDERGERRGKHHEIYLTDIRRADPAKWKTIIRQPMTES